jgi:flagellar hook-length control protein FliK
MPGTALSASNGAGAVFSMILAGMKGDPSGKGVQAGQVPPFNNSKSGNLLSSGRSLSLARTPNSLMSATEPAVNSNGSHRTRRTAVAGSQIPENAGDRSGTSSVAAKLESEFLTRGISLEKIVLENGDFEFLGAVLEKMGFSQPRIQQFFKQMMEMRSDGSITLADFFRDLITFEQDEKSGHGIPGSSLSGSLDKSAIPHLELILRDLGVSAEKTDQMLVNAARQNGSLDMDKLVIQLKQYAAALEKNAAVESNQTSKNLSAGKQTNLDQTSVPSARNMAEGLSKLGVSVSNSDAGTPFSLKAFIAALEQKHQGSAQATKPAAVYTAALTDSQNEMPALRSMEMEKIHTFFGFAKEMMFGSKYNETYDLSKGRMSVHQNQAKDSSIPPGQLTQLLKEAGIAPEKISAIVTSAAQQSNSREIGKPVSDLKSEILISAARTTQLQESGKPEASVSGRGVHPGIKAAVGMGAGEVKSLHDASSTVTRSAALAGDNLTQASAIQVNKFDVSPANVSPANISPGAPVVHANQAKDSILLGQLTQPLKEAGIAPEKISAIVTSAAQQSNSREIGKPVSDLKSEILISAARTNHSQESGKPQASVSGRDVHPGIKAAVRMGAGEVKSLHDASSTVTRSAALAGDNLTQASAIQVNKFDVSPANVSPGAPVVHANQAKDSILLGQLTQLLKEAGIAPEKISAIVTSAAQQSNSREIGKPVSDLKSEILISAARTNHSQESGKPQASESGRDVHPGIKAAVRMGAGEVKSLHDASSTVTRSAALAGDNLTQASAIQVNKFDVSPANVSPGAPVVHANQAKDSILLGQLTQLLKEAGIAPEKISAIVTSAAQQSNSREIGKPVSDLKSEILISAARTNHSQESGKPQASESGRDVHPGIKAAVRMGAGEVKSLHDASSTVTRSAALAGDNLTQASATQVNKFDASQANASPANISPGAPVVHANQAKDSILLSQLTQLLKEAEIAPEKISAIVTSAAQQSNSKDIGKREKDLKKNAAISDYRPAAALKNTDQTRITNRISDKNNHIFRNPDNENILNSSTSHQQIYEVLKETQKEVLFNKDLTERQGMRYDGISGMNKPQTATATFADINGLANIGKNIETRQNTSLPAPVVNQVGKEIAGFIQRGERFFSLQLKPPELGMVNIEMDVKENVLKMSIVTETGSAKDLLQANYADLRRVLEGYGIKVEALDVQLGSNLNQSGNNGDNPLNQQNNNSSRFGKNVNSTGQTGEDESVEPSAPQLSRESLVDLLA